MMDEHLERALAPSAPGPTVRTLARVLPGVRRTRDQITEFAAEWRAEANVALAGGGPVLVVFGDSIGQGIGASARAHGYAALVAAALDLPVVNLSKSGATTEDVIDVQLPAFAASGCSIAAGVCTVGSNDLLRTIRLSAARRRLTAVIERLPPAVAIATLPDAGSLVAKRLNRHLRAEADRAGRPVADVAARLRSWRGRVAGDGFHPNDAGHRVWADAALAVLRPGD